MKCDQDARDNVESVLSMINDKRIEREQDRSQYPTTRPYLVDREETDTSIFDTLRAIDGSAEIEDMTNIHHA
ncbi:hypothetical protein F444_10527 [Phytophthora nicotianae P1976]|uniref:Uncharacterized protein n=1 Tax=Phytophthora nicotianae P1976 TaxID=1317066 RepID=A0A081A3S2_PHYNI|nr:hypothetical protein F444_10527 [Phytophthora nicotianae P1976]